MLTFLRSLLSKTVLTPQSEKGQDLAEYALLIGLIALVVVGAVTILGGNLTAVFQGIADTVGGWFN